MKMKREKVSYEDNKLLHEVWFRLSMKLRERVEEVDGAKHRFFYFFKLI